MTVFGSEDELAALHAEDRADLAALDEGVGVRIEEPLVTFS